MASVASFNRSVHQPRNEPLECCQWSASSELPIIESAAGALDLFEDIRGADGPDERIGLQVVLVDVNADGHNEFFHVVKRPAP